jgi:hypothetical protein
MHSKLGLGWFNVIGNNNQINVYTGAGSSEDCSDFENLRVSILSYASQRRMKKVCGFVYAPVEGCPCAHKPVHQYAEFVNLVLKGDPLYLRNPRRFDEMMKFMQNYEVDEMPKYVPDRNLLSFSNGVLSLMDAAFTPYAGMEPAMCSLIARHHISQPYTGDVATPLLDTVLSAQFEPDVIEVLFALIGRLFFAVGQLDKWQVMPYLVGVGGTGKSLILCVINCLFNAGAVGNLASKREEVFGMANLVEKELVMGRDMPAKLSGALPQELMQVMTAGEGMEVARKGQTAINVTWSAPVIMASNHMPDYTNTGNNVGRRIVTFRFDNVVTNPKEDLLDSICATELPNILARCVGAYHAACIRVKGSGGFWKSVPPKLLEWQGKLAAATNKVHEFLEMDEDERGCSITFIEGHVTWLLDFKAAYMAAMKTPYVADPAVFQRFGYATSDKRWNCCKACRQIAKKGCCASFSNDERLKKDLIFNMRLVRLGSVDI